MNSINILDCTLRDGGYVNNWNFKKDQINKILVALDKSNIEIIECGYLNDTKGKQNDSTLFNSIAALENYLIPPVLNNKQKVVMINFGDFNVYKLPAQKDTMIDGIRLAFHIQDVDKAIESSKQIISFGYKLYFQPMVTKNYKDIEFLSLIEKVNKINPFAFYIVDSFGSMSIEEFHKYLVMAHCNLNSQIILGYHAHNNMQLALANAVNMCMQNLHRKIIIDSSIFGIGRGAGNLNSELIADYLNKSYNKQYDTLPLLEIIDEILMSLMAQNPWGFSPAQFLSASYNCHPNYATYLISKNTNHIVNIKKILDTLPKEHKSTYNKKIIEQLYNDFILLKKCEVRGNINISKEKKILVIASGQSVSKQKSYIKNKISKEDYLIIAINHIPFCICDYYFFTNQIRYDQFSELIDTKKLVVTNNIEIKVKPLVVQDFSKLAFEHNDQLITNATMMVINLLIQQGVKMVEIAGLDGYKLGIDNYSYLENQISYDLKSQEEKNTIIRESLNYFKNKINIKLVTHSIFSEEII